MQVSDTSIIILSIALVLTACIISFNKFLAGRSKVPQETPKGVKSISKEGQEDFVGSLKDSAAEALAFKDQQIEAFKREIKSLTGQVTKLKGLLYGTADETEIAQRIIESQQVVPSGKKMKGGTVSEDVINMRMRLMADKLKIPPALMQFDVISETFRDIAADERFDEIAATALSSQNQPTITQKNDSDL